MLLVTRVLVVLSGCLALLCAPVSAAEPTLPAGFTSEPLASGLDAPTGFAFRPDGGMYVIQKAGRVHRVTPGGARSLWLDLNASSAVPPVNQWWDRGLVGVAVDGQWPAERFVYLLYVSDGWDDGDDGFQDADAHSSLLVRVPVQADGSAGTPEVILGADGMGEPCPGPSTLPDGALDPRDYNDVDCLPIDGDTHAVGTVRSAPDGTLYVGTGDGAGFDGIDQRALRSQRPDSFAGKIIRVDREGRGVAGHPFCAETASLDTVCAKTHATGFRNPFRFALTPDGRLAVGDVGWGAREEITLTPPGANGGWPCWEGSLENDTYSGAELCGPVVSESVPREPVGVTLPDWEYDRVGAGGSIVGGPAYTGTSYPEEYRGSLLVGDYAQGWLRHLPANGTGGWRFAPSLVTDWSATSALPLAGTAFGGPAPSPWVGVDLGTHPANGDVVYADIGEVTPWGAILPGTGRVVRIRYAPGNGRPVARATATPSSGTAPLQTELSATGSTDPDGDELTYAWDLDGDGDTDATTPTVQHTYADPGAYIARVTVDDGHGLTNSATVRVTVQETAPEVEVLADSDTTFAGGAPITLRARATDEQDGALSGASLSWSVNLVHHDHTHLLGTYTGTQPALPAGIDDHDSDSHYAITLTATDSSGLTDTASWRLDPRTATVKLRSVPAGARMQYGDRPFDAPADHTSTIGLRTSVTPVAAFERDGVRYEFAGWDGGSATRIRAFTVPADGATLTARYNARPVAALDVPATYRAGEALTLRATGTDPEDGALTGAALGWKVQRTVDGTAAGPPVRGTGTELPLTAAAADEPDAAYEITLTARDTDGAESTATARLRPQTATVRLRSVPAGAALTYDGTPLADGAARTAVVGAAVRIAAPDRHGELRFESWDDRNPARDRGLEVPAGDSTLTARYAAVPPPTPPEPPVVTPEPPAGTPPAPDTGGTGLRVTDAQDPA
ncbi:MAG: PQQ-dependent sugar dehydrogenase, partial [Solirubrobacteraceae bacterium]